MAKIIHNTAIDVIDNVFSAAKEKGIMHINSSEDSFDGTKFLIKGKELINFGTCGYMGLETHPKVIEGAITLTKKYGTQLSMSRAFMRPKYIQELEELLSIIFKGNKVITFSSTSAAHIGVIGTIIRPDDMVIIDQQVHFSVQFPAKNTRLQGTEVQMIKHSDYDELDKLIGEHQNKYKKIWYMADGVYSMHGDMPDANKLKTLMGKYPKLHLYFDDAHGMSWGGTNGAGLIFEQLGLNERIVIISTLAKGFGCVGGTAVFADSEAYRKVDVFGGPLSYSHPLTPATVGSAIESAKIHLSDELVQYQRELSTLTSYMDKRLTEYNLPNLSAPNSPIYCIGVGYNKVTRNFVHRILNAGIYVNTATFPVVPNDKSGLRFTITRHNTKSDINLLADTLTYHFAKAIEEENDTMERVYQKFNFPFLPEFHSTTKQKNNTHDLVIEEYNTINSIDAELWDLLMEHRGNISFSGMQCMEEIFSNNSEKENNWTFHYIIIKDKQNQPILATFFTGALYKDDMLAPENVSKQIEEIRKKDPYYLCSQTLAMGSMFAEGDFIYLNTQNSYWTKAVELLFKTLEKIKKQINATVVVFRDFEEGHPLNSILEDEGYAKLRMPNSNVITNKKWENYDDLLSQIQSKRKRKNISQYAIRHEKEYAISIKKTINNQEAEHYFNLFLNVKYKNFAFNFFTYPSKTTDVINKYNEWEFIEICQKEKPTTIICVIWCYKGRTHYCPLIMGIDYERTNNLYIYKQAVLQIVKRTNELNCKKTYLGFSADFEKSQYDAISIEKYCFFKMDSTNNFETIESFSNIN
jgi:7-keto-8-aminopelargonate synthetase-like enzyme